MSEYWKSTPKYWCKFCKTYVRDTKFERQQHESTGRHQGNIQRSLRTLHRDNEREEREKQRAKDEVARLNGIVSGASAPPKVTQPAKQSSGAHPPANTQATQEERKMQMKQLADMGVAIPKEFRGNMALAGEWETIRETVVAEEEVKAQGLSYGVRKRKHDGAEEEEEAGEAVVRRGWGSTVRTYPGGHTETEDIEALLKGGGAAGLDSLLKKEEHDDENETKPDVSKIESPADHVKDEESPPPAAVVFKKRKSKVLKAS